MPDRFPTGTLDAELAPGARNALRVCLRLQPSERITIITDETTRDIAAALQAEVEEIGAAHAIFVLEDYAERPLTHMPKPILDQMAEGPVLGDGGYVYILKQRGVPMEDYTPYGVLTHADAIRKRYEEFFEAGVDVIMLEEGVGAKGIAEQVKPVDVLELVAARLQQNTTQGSAPN